MNPTAAQFTSLTLETGQRLTRENYRKIAMAIAVPVPIATP